MIDSHHLLPGSQSELPVSNLQDNRRAQKSSLDMAVPVAVMPSLFVFVFKTGGCQSFYGSFQVFNGTGFKLNGGDRPG